MRFRKSRYSGIKWGVRINPLENIRSMEYMIMHRVCDVISEFYDLEYDSIRAKTRKERIVFPRQVAQYIIRTNYQIPLKLIGDFFSQDHSTVVHAVNIVETRMEQNKNLRNFLEMWEM